MVGLPDPLPLRRIRDTDLWYVTTEMPEGSRVEYQFEIVRGEHREEYVNDPLNPKLAHGPFGAQLGVLRRRATRCPTGACPTRRPGPARSSRCRCASKALRRDRCRSSSTCPARFRTVLRYPLLIVHDGDDYLDYAAAKTVLDNLIHRGEVAEMVVAFVPPGNRLVEYANHAPHARFLARELVPHLTETLPARRLPGGPHPDGVELRWGGVALDGRPLPADCSARCCWSRRRSSSPTSARTTAAARPSTRW